MRRFALVVMISLSLSACSSGSNLARGDKTKAAETRLQLGLEYLAHDDLKAARVNLERAVAYAPQDYRTQLGMALYEQHSGEPGLAEQRYIKALALSPKNSIVLNHYGVFLCSLGDYSAAQQQFADAVQFAENIQKADSLENAGYCFIQAGQYEKAETFLSRVLSGDPDKGHFLLSEAERLFKQKNQGRARILVDIYHGNLSANAESLWLNILLSASEGQYDYVSFYGRQLAQDFPHSKQYQQYLANEY